MHPARAGLVTHVLDVYDYEYCIYLYRLKCPCAANCDLMYSDLVLRLCIV